jgi:N-acetylmuramoyl-L-alanine amidase
MKKQLAVLLSALLAGIFLYLLLFAGRNSMKETNTGARSIARPAVIVDAGHGGEDGGAVAPDGTVEKELNLAIAKKLNERLLSAGFRTIMIRGDDYAVYDEGMETLRQKKSSDLHNRLKIMETNPDALFVSIHQNIFSASSVRGAQVLYSPNHPESKILAQMLQGRVAALLQPENTFAVKKSGTSIFLLYQAPSPAVLVECGFLSNHGDLERLKTDIYQSQMAFAIFCGILDYVGTK